MSLKYATGELVFNDSLSLNPKITKQELMSIPGFTWEAWPDNGGNTVSYRSVFPLKKTNSGDIYLVVSFFESGNSDVAISHWNFAPDKLLAGEQESLAGNVTQRLKRWFKEQTRSSLPLNGVWGSIGVAYDVYNRTATVNCHYRSAPDK
ncbi:hypothetical protein [Pantoea sp. Lij88]|uniref:hypothetical protein n=1 Tax=Pantoea sp. Lij88 TaxID=3028622 RepID=UPI0024BBE922|nr:hypothetical protein [Pantoea sp. Lij88]WHQ74102.1 hypothetical protein PU624_14880 [Pantoea sp. Lij88]